MNIETYDSFSTIIYDMNIFLHISEIYPNNN